MGVSEILAQIDSEIAQLQKARALLEASVATKPAVEKKKGKAAPAVKKAVKKKKRNLSPEGRKAIADAVKRRWAAQKKSAAS